MDKIPDAIEGYIQEQPQTCHGGSAIFDQVVDIRGQGGYDY